MTNYDRCEELMERWGRYYYGSIIGKHNSILGRLLDSLKGTICPACRGDKKIAGAKCSKCKGKGRISAKGTGDKISPACIPSTSPHDYYRVDEVAELVENVLTKRMDAIEREIIIIEYTRIGTQSDKAKHHFKMSLWWYEKTLKKSRDKFLSAWDDENETLETNWMG